MRERRSGTWLVGILMALTSGCGDGRGATRAAATGACGDQTLPATLQAEDGELTGADVASEVVGHSGTGYVSGLDQTGDQATLRVCAPEPGYYTAEFRYAKGSEGIASGRILVDGTEIPGPPYFPPTWAWSNWTSGGRVSFHLEAGDHTVSLAHRDGAVLLDAMTFSRGPSSTETSVRAVLMNDWEDLVVGWHAGKLFPADESLFGPRMTAFHWAGDWPTNQIDEAQLFLRDDTGGQFYGEASRFETSAFFTANDGQGFGELHVQYGTYGAQPLPVEVTRRQVLPPGERFVLVRYRIENVTEGSRRVSLLEWADLHNKTAGPSEDRADSGSPSDPTGTLSAEWNPEIQAWIVDMTETNQTVLVIGAFQPVDRHVAGAPVTGGPDVRAEIPSTFGEDPSALPDAAEHSGPDVGVGLARTLELERGGAEEVAFFYGVADSVEAAFSLAGLVRTRTPDEWAAQTSDEWKGWLESGSALSLDPSVPEWAEALQVALVTIRHSQQPEFGSFVAATNPAYFYSVWPRDASVTAMGLDAAGYHDQAEKYWTWMAQAQADGSVSRFPRGTWWTNYSYWHPSEGIAFISPEWDSLGLFMVGVYHHYQALDALDPARASRFLADVWDAVENAADFIANNVSDENHGFGPPDFSIWEENLAYNTFTQTTYVAGLRAAELLGETLGSGRTGEWGRAADSVRSAIFRNVDAESCPGLWNADLSYFIRSVFPDCTPNKIVDASSDILWVLGVLRPESDRALAHREAILANLTPSEVGYGIARYEGDKFYYSAEFSPGGQYEAQAAMPTWPQMAMYMTMLEHWLGMDDVATNRLSWYVATTPTGYMPHGEAVDWTTQRPLISTASEPVTGAWFILALTNHLDLFDPRVPPRESWTGEGDGGSALRVSAAR